LIFFTPFPEAFSIFEPKIFKKSDAKKGEIVSKIVVLFVVTSFYKALSCSKKS